ncbi:MAG: transglutaminase-like domain-containing protein [Actinomycetota bacterium]
MSAPSDRLGRLLEADEPRLDRLMAVVASLATEPPEEASVVAALDALAAELEAAEAPPAAAVVAFVFGDLAFVGNTANYYDPANSFIHRVLDRRKGIPITLSAVAAEVGRRLGTPLSIVGLPGHVIIGDGPDPSQWFDPFAGGAPLDHDACRRLFARFHPVGAFDDAMLRPIPPSAVVQRMLGNLKLVYRRRGDLGQLVRVLELLLGVPGTGVTERLELAAVLAALGRYDQAAEQRELLVALDPGRASEHLAAAERQRVRRN